MRFSLIKALKSTHKHPVNKILHGIGLLMYAVALLFVFYKYIGMSLNSSYILLFVITAISLFLLGHKIEGNLKAMTWIVLIKYLKAKLKEKGINRYVKIE